MLDTPEGCPSKSTRKGVEGTPGREKAGVTNHSPPPHLLLLPECPSDPTMRLFLALPVLVVVLAMVLEGKSEIEEYESLSFGSLRLAPSLQAELEGPSRALGPLLGPGFPLTLTDHSTPNGARWVRALLRGGLACG